MEDIIRRAIELLEIIEDHAQSIRGEADEDVSVTDVYDMVTSIYSWAEDIENYAYDARSELEDIDLPDEDEKDEDKGPHICSACGHRE